MTLTISHEAEEKIEQLARERGLSADQYASELLERSLASSDFVTDLQQRIRAGEFLRRDPRQQNIASSWQDESGENTTLSAQRSYQLPPSRRSAEELAAALQALAGTDTPAKEYPPDFFSRDVVNADYD